MRTSIVTAAAVAYAAAVGTAQAAVMEIPYPAVKVKMARAHEPDAVFEQLQKALADAVAKKDAQALFVLVGPSFVWLSGGEISDQFAFGRDALHNFKVVFGFRDYGKDTDGGVADGPFWDSLAAFAGDKTYYEAADTLVCGPTAALLVDDNAIETAKQHIGADDSVEWYFTVADTDVVSTPAGTGAPVGKASQIALPVLNVYPAQQGQSAPPITHLQVLLPTGKSGWIPLTAARPLVTDRLCYSLTSSGWKISAFDQAQ